MFEGTSAMRVVGVSVGDGDGRSFSTLITDFGKLVIIASMLIGRFGTLLIGLFAVYTSTPPRYRFPESRVMIG